MPKGDPFAKTNEGRISDGGTPQSEMTHSSLGAGNFMDLKGPTVPNQMKDRITDELPESAMPPTFVFTPLSARGGRQSSNHPPLTLSRLPTYNHNTSNIDRNTHTITPSPLIESPLSPTLYERSSVSGSAVPTSSHPLASSQPPSATTTTRPVLPGHPTAPYPKRPTMSRLPTESSVQKMVHAFSDPPPSRRTSDPLNSQTNGQEDGGPSSKNEDEDVSSVRALVVDDDPLTRRLMERMLKVRMMLVQVLERIPTMLIIS